MSIFRLDQVKKIALYAVLALLPIVSCDLQAQEPSTGPSHPLPMLSEGRPVDWWFAFKFNATTFPSCGTAARSCPFGGTPEAYRIFSQQFIYASSADGTLHKGNDCLGDDLSDPVAATFAQAYNGSYFYAIWNDQFYGDPAIKGCGDSCGAPWGHSKGMLVWDTGGDGFVLQVTTPSWPGAGSSQHPRLTDGNTLGCVKDNDVQVSQHFFSIRLTRSDVLKVLHALQNASVVTDPNNPQIVHNGGPAEIQEEVKNLGKRVSSKEVLDETLSTGVELISKPSGLNVPPWQLVSSVLHGVSLRTATWWTRPAIPSTTSTTSIDCWSDTLEKPGSVQIATSGIWDSTVIGLTGGPGGNFNHAKIGVSISGADEMAIFGDMNQQGALSGNCKSSQNGRGGLFYVVRNKDLAHGVLKLMQGNTAPTTILPATVKK
ncbi:deoxyribonuclease II family protein [Granulicella sp. dw_53]|uniref:deoxyribonuclease II family protein n=1 Tax=Granulicella sp. dw_53 TaxID=2719792 RepID=UPI001BD1CE76|nr:deoxyribonuclease II family protein [Granulicella sp. dw_53]